MKSPGNRSQTSSCAPNPAATKTRTDARGYFQIHVPVQTLEAATNSPARLAFTAPGFRSEERTYLELWSEGDWIYRIRLDRGAGIKTVDERTLRRRSEYPVATLEQTPADTAPVAAVETAVHGAVTTEKHRYSSDHHRRHRHRPEVDDSCSRADSRRTSACCGRMA
jgi:hypothetical protein